MDVRDVLERLIANRLAVIGLVLSGGIVLLAILAPVLASTSPDTMIPGARFAPPSLAHPFGADDFGRDLFSRVLYGARISLQVGLIATTVSTLIGLLVGLVAGYSRGRIDTTLMRAMDVLMAFPAILLALFVMAVLGSSLRNVVIAVAVGYIPFFARITRGQVMALVEAPFVEASRALGATHIRIITRHVFPNVVPLLIVQATASLAIAILAESALSYLGLGTRPPEPSWGRMLTEARPYINQAPWMAIFPGLALLAITMGSNLLGDGLRDALDPRLRGTSATPPHRTKRSNWIAQWFNRVAGRKDVQAPRNARGASPCLDEELSPAHVERRGMIT